MTPAGQDDRNKFVTAFLLGLVCLSFCLYLNAVHAPFVFDDRTTIVENESLKDLPGTFLNFSARRYAGMVTFAFNYRLGGLKTAGYHTLNTLIHAASGISVFFLVMLLFRTPAMKAAGRLGIPEAGAAALLFMVHPIQTQAVTYLSQRFASLSALFYLISAVCYLRARLSSEKHLSDNKRRLLPAGSLSYASSLAAAFLAMKTKESALTLPIMLAAVEFYFWRETGLIKQRLIRLSPFFLLLLGILIGFLVNDHFADNAARAVDASLRETTALSRQEYAAAQVRVIATYLRLLFFPINQNLDYAYATISSLPVFLFSLMLLFSLLAAAVLLFRPLPLLSFGIVWFFVALSVESSIIPISDVMNEHRLYLPSVGFFLAAASLVQTGRTIRRACMAAVILLLSIGTVARNNTWNDPELLWKDAASKAPHNVRAVNNLGVVYKERMHYDQALNCFREAVRMDRQYLPAAYNLGDISYRLGRYEEALRYLTFVLDGRPDDLLLEDTLNKLGRTYGAMGMSDSAIATLEKALKRFPRSVLLMNNLAVQYLKKGDPGRAIEILKEALTIREEEVLLQNLAVAYKSLDKGH